MISEIIQAWEGFIFVVFMIGIPLSTLLIWVGLRIAKFKRISLLISVGASIFFFLFIYTVTILLSALPFFSTVPAYILGLIISFILIKIFFPLKSKRLIVIWTMSCLAQIVSVLIAAFLFIGGICDLIQII